ncbi:hypothetical protein [Corynebacterium spheniscorum]|uniref:DNA-binding transcriptional regulator of glucitol operon n=1 Tax=Corynebacterium spheniscorum TaxID=185761 RepID=A0A1I2QED9_9CORY|nr:hypothetical protein [Corynebacterium spheniscorum]SFG25729.1 DNA-binding transcriptional regulator of glucitol operon [Corynebacterium spheniscorum]
MAADQTNDSETPNTQPPAQPETQPAAQPAPDPALKPKELKRVKVGHVLFLILAVCCTIALAWWQWSRFRSGSGTFQNLGYALQWPMFGAFFVIAYRKYLQYENEAIELENEELGLTTPDPHAEPKSPRRSQEEEFSALLDDFLPERPSLDVEQFNELNVQRRGSSELAKNPKHPETPDDTPTADAT